MYSYSSHPRPLTKVSKPLYIAHPLYTLITIDILELLYANPIQLLLPNLSLTLDTLHTLLTHSPSLMSTFL